MRLTDSLADYNRLTINDEKTVNDLPEGTKVTLSGFSCLIIHNQYGWIGILARQQEGIAKMVATTIFYQKELLRCMYELVSEHDGDYHRLHKQLEKYNL